MHQSIDLKPLHDITGLFASMILNDVRHGDMQVHYLGELKVPGINNSTSPTCNSTFSYV